MFTTAVACVAASLAFPNGFIVGAAAEKASRQQHAILSPASRQTIVPEPTDSPLWEQHLRGAGRGSLESDTELHNAKLSTSFGISRKIRRANPWAWIIGIVATVAGLTLTMVGFLLQKYAHVVIEAGRPYYLSKVWIQGLFAVITGQVLCICASGLANQTVLGAFSCWSIIVVYIVTPYVFNEKVNRYVLIGAAAITGGSLWASLAGPKRTHEFTEQDFFPRLAQPAFLYVLIGSLVILLLAGVPLIPWSSVAERDQPRQSKSYPARLAAVAAVFSWYAVLCTKAASCMVAAVLVFNDKKLHVWAWNSWPFWIVIGGSIVCAVAQIHFLNVAMKSGEALVVIPIYQSLQMAGIIVICGVFFQEFQGWPVPAVVNLCCGLAIVAGGILQIVYLNSISTASETTAPVLAAPLADKLDKMGHATSAPALDKMGHASHDRVATA